MDNSINTRNLLKAMAFIILFMCLFTNQQGIFADSINSVDLASHANGKHLGKNYYYLIDNSNNLELEDVRQSPQWLAAGPGNDNRGLSNTISWMKFTVHNSSADAINSIFAYVDHGVASIDFYYREIDKNQPFNHQNFTFNKPVDTRPVAFFRPAFAVNLNAQQSSEVYVKLNPGDTFPMHTFTSFRVWEQNAFYSSKDKELAFLVALLCIELFMALLTLTFFINTRDKVFLFYSIFALSAISLFASVSGIWGYFVASTNYEMWHVLLQVNISQIAALLFVRVFLETKKHLPKIDKFLILIIIFCAIGVILNLAGKHFYSRNITDYTSLCFLTLIPIGLLASKKGIRHAILFTISWVVFIAGMACGALRLRGVFPDNYATEWIIYAGGLIEITLLLSIMVMRLNKLTREKELAESLYRKSLEQSAQELSIQVDKKTQELIEAKTKAENEARIDILTGLTNRRAFIEIAERALARSKRNVNNKLFLALVDIDLFKQVNDTYGHAAGDYVLQQVTKTLSESIREIDVVSRIGGEEFAIIIENNTYEKTKELSERLRQAIEDLELNFDNNAIVINISIGVAEYKAPDSLDELLKASDKALYQAKLDGRNRVVFS